MRSNLKLLEREIGTLKTIINLKEFANLENKQTSRLKSRISTSKASLKFIIKQTNKQRKKAFDNNILVDQGVESNIIDKMGYLMFIFYLFKFMQVAFKNAKYYLAMVLLFTIKNYKTNANTNDNTIEVLIYLCFFSLLLSRVLQWIFLQDFQQKKEAALTLPLHLTGLIDFYYIVSDAKCTKPHNSLRFYISNILSAFCFPAYLIVVILIDYLYQGIETQIISTIVMLSSLVEFFVYYQFGLKTACKINQFTNEYLFVLLIEFLTSCSFLGLIILNIRFSLGFLIAYFSYLPILLLFLPCCSQEIYVNNGKVNWFQKTVFLTCFWLCVYQPCINKVQSRKKMFADIPNASNNYFIFMKYIFYQGAYFFFIGYRKEIENQVTNSSQIQALFVIATICQLKLLYELLSALVSCCRKRRSILEINNICELDRLLQQCKEKADFKFVKNLVIRIKHMSTDSWSKVFHLCMCYLEGSEIVINNSNSGRFFFDENLKSQIVKLEQSSDISYASFLKDCETERICPSIHFLSMNLKSSDTNTEASALEFMRSIYNSNILYFNFKHDSSVAKAHQPILDYQKDQAKNVMQYLVFKTYFSPYINLNPQVILYDLHDDFVKLE